MDWFTKGLAATLALIAGIATAQQVRLTDAFALTAKPEGSLRIATWNVHYIILNQPEGRWGMSGWEERKGALSTVFGILDADLIAFQEMESFSRGSDGSINLARDWLLANHHEYSAAARGPWQRFPPTQPIFYRHDVLSVHDEGWFFFSQTPDRLYARGFDGATPSFASWVIFEHRASGERFRIVNVHPDAKSRTNRRAAADLVAQRIAPWIDAGETVLLAGDLNALHGAYTHRTIAQAGLTFPSVAGPTFHFGRGWHLFGAIDHIGLSKGAQAASQPSAVQASVSGVYPADHHPVVLDFELVDR